MNFNQKKPTLTLTKEQLDVIAASLLKDEPRYKDSWGDRWGVNGPKPLDRGYCCRHGSSNNEFIDRMAGMVGGGSGIDPESISNRGRYWQRYYEDGRSGFDIP